MGEVISFDIGTGAIQFKFGLDYDEVSGYLEIPYYPGYIDRDQFGSFHGNRKIQLCSYSWERVDWLAPNITWEHWQPTKMTLDVNVAHGEKYSLEFNENGEMEASAEFYFDTDYEVKTSIISALKPEEIDEYNEWLESQFDFDTPLHSTNGNALIIATADDSDVEIKATIDNKVYGLYMGDYVHELKIDFIENVGYAACGEYFAMWWFKDLDDMSICRSQFSLKMSDSDGWYFQQDQKSAFKESWMMSKWTIDQGWSEGSGEASSEGSGEGPSSEMVYIRAESKNNNLDSFNDDLFMGVYWVGDADNKPATYIKAGEGDLLLRAPGVQGFQTFVAPLIEKKMEKFWMQLIDPIVTSEEPMYPAFMLFFWFDQAVAGTVKKNSFNFVDIWLASKINSDAIWFLNRESNKWALMHFNDMTRDFMRDLASDRYSFHRNMRRFVSYMGKAKKEATEKFSF